MTNDQGPQIDVKLSMHHQQQYHQQQTSSHHQYQQRQIGNEAITVLSWRRLHLSRAKLKASSRTSALLSGFAMVAMVEVSLDSKAEDPLPTGLLVAFILCTTLLVSIHILALMISTCILPNIEAISMEEAPEAIADSPHESLSHYIEIAWIFSTVFGVFLFLVEIAILCWVQFWNIGGIRGTGKKAALVATISLIPVFIVFILFATHFYRKLVTYTYERSVKTIEELETMASSLQPSDVTFLSQAGCSNVNCSVKTI